MSSASRNAAAINAKAMAEFRKQLEALPASFEESAKRIVNRMAYTGLAVSKEKTHVGVYSKRVSFFTTSGKLVQFTTGIKKQGGTLKRAWVKDPTRRVGNAIVGGYSNDAPYAMYVNNGHRIVSNGITWGLVPGQHMLELGIKAVEQSLPSLLDAEIKRIKGETGF